MICRDVSSSLIECFSKFQETIEGCFHGSFREFQAFQWVLITTLGYFGVLRAFKGFQGYPRGSVGSVLGGSRRFFRSFRTVLIDVIIRGVLWGV